MVGALLSLGDIAFELNGRPAAACATFSPIFATRYTSHHGERRKPHPRS